MAHNKSKGFTLMELIVVIAIIGVLASIVLTSLNTVRIKGSDASAKSALGQLRAQAEMYYDTHHNYGVSTSECSTVAGDAMFDGDTMANIIQNLGTHTSTSSITCASDSNAWAVSAVLRGGGTWCVDSTGKSASSTRNGVACN